MTSAKRRSRPLGRHEPRRQDLARRGAAVVLVFAALLALAYVRANGGVGGDPEVSAELRNAGGSLRPGSDVKISGVIVGKVTEITRGPDGDVRVGVRMAEDDLASVPANVVARILPATVFGTSFVDLVVYHGPSDEALEAGAVIPADTTQGTLELQQALDDIDRLVKALGPAELASAIGSAALALEGRGEKIGELIETADDYIARLTSRMPLVRSDVRKLAANLALVDQVAPDLLQATDDALVTVRTIVTQRAAITALISGGTAMARTSTDFLTRNRQRLVRLIDNGARLMDVLYDNRRMGISGSIATNIAVGRDVPTAIKEGFLKSDALLQMVAPPFYTAADRPSYAGAPARTSRLSDVGLRAMVGGSAQ